MLQVRDLGMKENARIGIWRRLHFELKLKILEIGKAVANTKQMSHSATRFELAIYHGKGLGLFIGFPTIERLAVEQRNPFFLTMRSRPHRQHPTESQSQPHTLHSSLAFPTTCDSMGLF